MSSTSGQSMNYLSPPLPKSSGSFVSYSSNSSRCSLFRGEVHNNSAYDYAESGCGSLRSGHDYEDLQSVKKEVKAISGPRKKSNDLYESTDSVPYRKRQITECSDDSMASNMSSEFGSMKRDTCLNKLILFLILAFSVAALVLVILIIIGKIGPKCSCTQGRKMLKGGTREKNRKIKLPSNDLNHPTWPQLFKAWITLTGG